MNIFAKLNVPQKLIPEIGEILSALDIYYVRGKKTDKEAFIIDVFIRSENIDTIKPLLAQEGIGFESY